MSICSRSISNFSIMETLRTAAKKVAKEFNEPGISRKYSTWGDCLFNEGMSIKDQTKFDRYTKLIRSDIENLHQLALRSQR